MLVAIIAVLAIIADQVTKFLVVKAATPVDSLLEGNSKWAQEFIPGFLSFRYRQNDGGGWSILDGGGIEWFALNAISVAAIIFMVIFLIKNYRRHPLINVSLAMVLGGALGNMIDRLRLGYVVDFLNTEFIEFPTFNIADCFITVGAILLGVYIIFFDAKVEKRLKLEKEAAEMLVGFENTEESTETEEKAEAKEDDGETKETCGENEEIETEEKGEND